MDDDAVLDGQPAANSLRLDDGTDRAVRGDDLVDGRTLCGVGPSGDPAILDPGFSTAAHRAAFAARAVAADYRFALQHVGVAADERWHRVERRDAQRGGTYAMTVDRVMVDFMEARWGAPDAAEMAQLNGVRHGSTMERQ